MHPVEREVMTEKYPDKIVKILTLAFIFKEDSVLLGLKKRGFGKGKWNGFGGKVSIGETVVEGAAREIQEECGLIVDTGDLEQCAVIDFEFEDDPIILQVHVFKTNKFTGEVTESEEMQPQWYHQNSVPHVKMWVDDEIWYPLLLQGIRFKAYFLFRGFSTILSYKLWDFDNENNIIKEMKLGECQNNVNDNFNDSDNCIEMNSD